MEFPSAKCEGFTVTYVDSLDRNAAVAQGDALRVLVPGGKAQSFHAYYRAGGKGARHEAVLSRQEVCVVPPLQACGLSSAAPADLTIFSFDREFFESQAREAKGYVPQIAQLQAVADPLIRSIGNTVRIGFRLGRPPSREYLQSISRTLALHVSEKYGAQTKPVACRGLSANRLKRVLSMIDARLGESIHVAELAEEVHMSPFHFARMFKHTTGQAPHVYITAQRMERAKQLLAEGVLPIAEVAQRVGYQTQAHFTGVFHANVGLTPRQYRIRNISESQ
jgi:AraC family transcriptional regulator